MIRDVSFICWFYFHFCLPLGASDSNRLGTICLAMALRIAGADHLIPMELALKIAKKIKAGERFAAYILIPMWPEGPPDSAAVQEILYFQVMDLCVLFNGVTAVNLNSIAPKQVFEVSEMSVTIATEHRSMIKFCPPICKCKSSKGLLSMLRCIA